MKRNEYLRELKENLEVKISQEELNDILADYESFFIAGKEEGKDEDTISKDLGSPAFLAKSLIDDQKNPHNKGNDKSIAYALLGKRILAFIIDGFIAVIPSLIIAGTFISTVLFITYPAPLDGASIYLSVATFSQFTSESAVTEIQNIDSNAVEYNNEKNNTERPSIVITTAILGSLFFYLLYSLVTTLILKGQTFGKRIMKIRVVKSSSSHAKFSNIFIRELIGKVLINSIPLVPLISLFTMLFTKENKTLHDMISDTIVVG